MFHRSVAQLLFMTPRSRRDIEIAVLFLTIIVKRPNEYDWEDMKIVLKFLKGTNHMNLTLRMDSLLLVNWWIDSSHNKHDEFSVNVQKM